MRTYYTIEYKLKVLVALDANNGNIYGTARAFGIPRQTVSNWNRDRELIFEQSETLAEERRLPLSRRLSLLINQISDALPEKVEKAQLGDATRALNILLDLRDAVAAREDAKRSASGSARAKLAEILDRYAEVHAAESTEE